MNLTELDHELERRVLFSVTDRLGMFAKIRWVQSNDDYALFDFSGWEKRGKWLPTAFAEVKVRDVKSTAFNNYIISKTKGDKVLLHRDTYEFYIIYYFTGDNVLKLFHLNRCDLIFDPNYDHFHKRDAKEKVRGIYRVPDDQCLMRREDVLL